MSTHNLCFEQKYEKYQSFYLKIFSFLEVKFSIYLNRHVFVISRALKYYNILMSCYSFDLYFMVDWLSLFVILAPG